MAGTPEGAAKARARLAAIKAARAEAEALMPAETDADELMPVLPAALQQGIEAFEPLALRAVEQGLRGKDRKGLAARAKLGVSVLGLIESKRKAGRAASGEAAAGLLAMLRRRAGAAEELEVLPADRPGGGDPVALPALVQSPQQPERQSDPGRQEPPEPSQVGRADPPGDGA